MAESKEKKLKLRFKNPVVWIDLEVSLLFDARPENN